MFNFIFLGNIKKIFCLVAFSFYTLNVISQNAVSQTVCPQISTYFGQLQFDELKGICRDTKGNIYGIGNTFNTNLPTTVSSYQQNNKGDYEAFIVKFDSCGTLIWCTYFGTNTFDSGEKIAYSNDSTIVIVGYTDGINIDTTFNCFQPVNNGGYDCFLAKFNLNGQAKWVTYFGNNNADLAYDVTVDNYNNVIIGGTTLSNTLYTNGQSFQQTLGGATDAFVAKFGKNGILKFCTLYGGLNPEDIHAVTTDANRNIIAVGGSTSNNLSTSPLCLQASSNGGQDVYVIKLDTVGIRIFSTYIGGSANEDAYGVCTDASNNIIVTGHTSSNDFYKTAISHQTVILGYNDNFCLKLSPTGTLVWSNIFGGNSFDYNAGCKINSSNEIVSLASSQSTDFPMIGINNFTVNNGPSDIVIAKILSNGSLSWSTYKGGAGNETANDLEMYHSKVIVCGGTSSSDFPVLPNNYQLINNGQTDAFVTTILLSPPIMPGFEEHFKNICNPVILNSENNFKLNLKCSGISKIKIQDVLGREVYKANTIKNELIFDLNFLNANELFFLSAFDENNLLMFTTKIFK